MIQRLHTELTRYLRTETIGGAILLAAAAVALIWANSPWADSYFAAINARLPIAALHLDLTAADWAKDGLLAVFFFVAGLELKREFVIGELADPRRALLPVLAAAGGVVAPAILAAAIGFGIDGMDRGWAIPVATDIAFALAVLAITGTAIPQSARVFLLSLAVVDDLIAIVLIAVLFTGSLALAWLGAALVSFAGYALAQRRRITSPVLYLPLAAFAWYALHEAGIHATLAGVILGLLTRVRRDRGEAQAPAARLEHRIQPLSAGVCVPLFAFCASGVALGTGVVTQLFTARLPLAIIIGLIVGKPLGIFGVSWLAIRTGLAKRPAKLENRDMFALSVLGAIGFTVSLLIAELALAGPQHGDAADTAKAAVLLTSLAASLAGAALLWRRGRVHEQSPRHRAASGQTDGIRAEGLDSDEEQQR